MNPGTSMHEYRRYQTYVRNYHPDHPIHKVCCGANVDDYEWTSEVLKTATHNHCLKELHGNMDGLSSLLCTSGRMEIKGSATDFDDMVWYKSLNKAPLWKL